MEGWREVKIADVVEPLTTINPKKRPKESFEYIDVSSVSRDTFTVKETSTLAGCDAPSRARRLVHSGDVLFATIRPTLQRIAIVPASLDNSVCSTGYFVLRPNGKVLSRFLFHYLFSPRFSEEMASLQRGASYPAVSDTDVKKHSLLLPPLPEQHRIVAILDEAFAAIATATANAERNVANARELFESELNRVFSQEKDGWVEKKLGEVVGQGCSLSYGIVQPGNDVPAGLPVVRPTDMKCKLVRLDRLKRIDPSRAASYGRTTLSGGDLLLCVRGSTGTVSVASDELAGANVTRGIVPILFNKELINQEFGYYILVSPDLQRQVKMHTYGAALMQINIRDIRQLTIRTPSLREQSALCVLLDAVSQSCSGVSRIQAAKLSALTELKQSILHKAFTGDLTADTGATDRTLSEAGL